MKKILSVNQKFISEASSMPQCQRVAFRHGVEPEFLAQEVLVATGYRVDVATRAVMLLEVVELEFLNSQENSRRIG